jgi:hypothetical protein
MIANVLAAILTWVVCRWSHPPQVSFMPILVLAARLCPEGVEATLFATLMSISNGGSFVGSALGAGLTGMLGVTSTDFSSLFPLVLLCNMSTLLPAPFLGLLPSAVDQEVQQQTSQQQTAEGPHSQREQRDGAVHEDQAAAGNFMAADTQGQQVRRGPAVEAERQALWRQHETTDREC